MGPHGDDDARRLSNDHWVSKGYQKNFADETHRVAVVDAVSGQVVDADRPIKSNFAEVGFTTFLDAGVPNDLLEKAFASLERSVLNEIRLVSPTRQGPNQRGAVINLFAIHFVRSPSYKWLHSVIAEEFRAEDMPAFVESHGLTERFESEFGRPPQPGELLGITQQAYADFNANPMTLVTSMIRQHDRMTDILSRFHMQIVLLDDRLPGFVLGDTPVVHAHRPSRRFGFKARLALGDADLIIGPLTRRTAVCFTAQRLPTVTLRTRKQIEAVNAMFARAALNEIACHPDDALASSQLVRRLDRIPPELPVLPHTRNAITTAARPGRRHR